MGRQKGCIQTGKVGRPKGAKDKEPRRRIQGTEDIRLQLAQAFRDRSDKLIPRAFVELSTLEGYAYLSGLQIMLKQILPALNSIELNANVERKESLLLEHIESLRLIKD